MPSLSWQKWDTIRARELDDIEAAHRSVGGTARGRRYATEQINHAYAVLLASQFQGFCRDLHSESVDCLVQAVAPAVLQSVLREQLVWNRSLDHGFRTEAMPKGSPDGFRAVFGRVLAWFLAAESK